MAEPSDRGDGTGGDEGGRFYVPGLDGLRAVAIAMVYAFHDRQLGLVGRVLEWLSIPLLLVVDPLLGLAGREPVSFRVTNAVSRVLVQNGWIGVQIFFVLSGYLIATLLLRERRRFGRVDLRAFWVRRILRIWPLYYLIVLICFAAIPAVSGWTLEGAWGKLLSNHLAAFLLFAGNWSMAIIGPAPFDSISVLWSVCVEEQFYLFVPLLIAWLGPRWRVPAVVALMASAIATRYAMTASGSIGPLVHRFSTLSNLDTLLAGVLLALARDGRPIDARWGRHARWPAAAGLLWLMFDRPGLGGPWRQAIDPVLIWLWSGSLVVLAASPEGRVSALLGRRRVVWLGRISYGLYLFHEIALGLVARLDRVLPSFPESSLIMALLAPALTIGLASASYYGFERPFLRLKGRWTRVPSRPVSGIAAAAGTGPGGGALRIRDS